MVYCSKLRNRAADDDGVVLVIVALLMVTVLLVAAFVIDFGNARQISRQSQGGTDAAALAAAQSLPVNGSAATTSTADPAFSTAVSYVANDLFQGVTPPTPVSTGCTAATKTCTYTVGTGASLVNVVITTPYNGNNNYVYVRACRSTPTYFAGAAGKTSPTVCRSAVARRILGQTITLPGVIALKQGTGCVDYSLSGSVASTIHVKPGAVIANCESSPPNNVNGSNAGIDATTFYSVGTCTTASTCVGPNSTAVQTIPEPVPDPLAALPAPSTTDPAFQRITSAAYNALACLDGYYDITTPTGGGDIDVIPTCATKTSFTYLRSVGVSTSLKAEVDQSCPTTGTYAGICLFLAHGNASTISWNGNSKGLVHYGGTVYAPDATVDWGGNVDVEIIGQVVAQTFLLHGGGGPKNEGFVVTVPVGTADIAFPADIGLQT